MCSLCTPQCVLQPPFLKHLIISPPIIGFWAAGAFGSSSCVWCSHVFGHRVSGIWSCGAFSVCCRVFYSCHRFGWFPGPRSLKTRAKYMSNNHLTGGSALWKRDAVTPNWGFWGNLGSASGSATDPLTYRITIRWSEGARKTFAPRHFEEGQTAPCAEKHYSCTEG